MDSPRPHTATPAGPRRAFTAPIPPSASQHAASPQSADGLVDTLYDHPSVKIVAFTAGARPFTLDPRAADVEPGSLPWSSPLERTIAVGPFRIYRAPGSVAFLSCGSALQPILPKSQVWCVDEESSKFILQIRRPQFWRIELPVAEESEVRLARHLREVFDAILLFEKTECPFQRPFTVELPERPQTPVKKRPWTPARRSSASLPLTPAAGVEIARLHEGTPRGSICMGDLRSARDARRALMEHGKSLEPPAEEPTPARPAPAPNPSMSRVERAKRAFGAQPTISPAIVSRRRSAFELRKPPGAASTTSVASPAESLESLQGRESWLAVPLPPSPPLSSPGSPVIWSPGPQTKAPQASTAFPAAFGPAVTAKPSQTWSVASDSAVELDCHDPTAPSVSEPSPTARQLPAKEKTPEPEPNAPAEAAPSASQASSSSASNPPPAGPPADSPQRTNATAPSRGRSQTPHRHRRRATSVTIPRGGTAAGPNPLAAAVRHLPLTVFVKTCEIFLSPPAHLISLMLNVAARIAAGEWSGLAFGMGEGGERVSVSWDWSEEEEEGEGAGSEARRRPRRNGWRDDDIWLKGRNGGVKMAGAYPESSDDDDEEEEEEVYDCSGCPEEPISPSRGGRGTDRDSKTTPETTSRAEASATGATAAEAGGPAVARRRTRAATEPEWGID
ncbi:hypothetical protein VTJ83DRAFT_2944 [Remersonia thermophila]|uniref:Inheritance of peroxisomes protein 1 n=1 Tax=Remersonia thermophila TaxID=72144 RepID=A0ABR4DCM8_9PEZI